MKNEASMKFETGKERRVMFHMISLGHMLYIDWYRTTIEYVTQTIKNLLI